MICICLWLSKTSANERTFYICNIISNWLRICSAIDRKRALLTPYHCYCHVLFPLACQTASFNDRWSGRDPTRKAAWSWQLVSWPKANTPCLTPCDANQYLETWKIYLHLLSLFNTEMAQAVQIPNQGTPRPIYSGDLNQWLVMAWWYKEAGLQHPWYWPDHPKAYTSYRWVSARRT